MPEEPARELTEILEDVGRGSDGARESLLEVVYDELHRLAESHMRGERSDHTLQPTALVHETYLRLFREAGIRGDMPSRAYFFAAVGRAMRQILVDHARQRKAQKRGSDRKRVPIDDVLDCLAKERNMDVLDLEEALEELDSAAPELRRIIELGAQRGAEVWLLTAPRNHDADADARERLASRNKTDFESLMATHDEYNDILRHVGRETGTLVVDMVEVYERYRGTPIFLPSDVVHPAQGGQNLEAETLYTALVRRGWLKPRPDAEAGG